MDGGGGGTGPGGKDAASHLSRRSSLPVCEVHRRLKDLSLAEFKERLHMTHGGVALARSASISLAELSEVLGGGGSSNANCDDSGTGDRAAGPPPRPPTTPPLGGGGSLGTAAAAGVRASVDSAAAGVLRQQHGHPPLVSPPPPLPQPQLLCRPLAASESTTCLLWGASEAGGDGGSSVGADATATAATTSATVTEQDEQMKQDRLKRGLDEAYRRHIEHFDAKQGKLFDAGALLALPAVLLLAQHRGKQRDGLIKLFRLPTCLLLLLTCPPPPSLQPSSPTKTPSCQSSALDQQSARRCAVCRCPHSAPAPPTPPSTTAAQHA